MIYFEVIGWIGSFIYILSYFLLSYRIIDKAKLYYLLNKIAAALVIIISLVKATPQPIVINSIWLYISYMAYHNKSIEFTFLNKFILHVVSILFFITFLITFFIDRVLSYEVLGWFSVFAFVTSYFLFTMEKIHEKVFHIYNFMAALSIIPTMYLAANYQVIALEVLWAFFALQAYMKNSKEKEYLTLCS